MMEMYLINEIMQDINQAVVQACQVKNECPIELYEGKGFDITIKPGFLLAKELKKKPEEIGQLVAKELEKLSYITNLEVIKGYVNLRFTDELLNKLSSQDVFPPFNSINCKVKFDYASINPTGPMHAGHLRSAVLADVVTRVFEFAGYKVTREYYLNDTGGQAKKLVEAVYARYKELLGHSVEQVAEYPGEYVKDIARAIIDEDGDVWLEKDYYERFRAYSVTYLLEEIKQDLKSVNIVHDEYFSEHEMYKSGVVDKVLEDLTKRGYVHEVLMDAPIAYKGEREHLPVQALKLVDLDDKVKALTKTDGSHTYLLGDIALHATRYNEGYDWIVDFFGADHAEHGQVLKYVLSKLFPAKQIDIETCQIVRFEKEGKEFKMSKRAGNYVTAKDIVGAVGSDAIRLEMISRTANSHLVVDVDKALELDENNPVFYIQYAHARCCSVLAKMQEDEAGDTLIEDFWQNEHARKLCMKSMMFPIVINRVIKTLDSHVLFKYLMELAQGLHALWGVGNQDQRMKLSKTGVVGRNLVKNIQANLGQCLDLLGVKAMERMG